MGLVVGGREGGFYKGNAPPLIMRARNGVHLLFLPDSWSLRGRSTLVYARYMDTLHARRPWRERNWKGAPRPARRTPAPTRRRPSRSQPAWRPGWRPARQRLRAPRGLGLLPILCFFSNDLCVEFACSNRRRPCITQAVKIRDAGREGKSPAACPPVDVLASARLSVGGIRCLGITSDRWLLRMRMLSRGQSTLRAAFGCAWRLGVDAMLQIGKALEGAGPGAPRRPWGVDTAAKEILHHRGAAAAAATRGPVGGVVVATARGCGGRRGRVHARRPWPR